MNVDASTTGRIASQRALEALRNGVPNGDAVRALGCMQPAALDAFNARLDLLRRNEAADEVTEGMVIAGGFGTGKSHTLAYLEQQALEQGFVVSRVVISKETPLHDAGKLYLAAVREARFRDGRGALLHELALRLDYRRPAGEAFLDWARRGQPHGMVAASVAVHERSDDVELCEQMVEFWSGEKLLVPVLRHALRGLGLQKAYDLRPVKIADLAPVRFEFASRLARAVGFHGWVVLLDEVELIGRYSLAQRARAYAELARCLGATRQGGFRGTLFAAAITDDFALAVIHGRNERETIRRRIGDKGDAKSQALAELAAVGMDQLERKAIVLTPPNDDTLQASYERLRRIYLAAYGREPADAFQAERDAHRPMRSYVRRWIWSWDLARLGERPEIIEDPPVVVDSGEDPDLAAEATDDATT
jgi:hypothetical protein